jgi:hypothetical protein
VSDTDRLMAEDQARNEGGTHEPHIVKIPDTTPRMSAARFNAVTSGRRGRETQRRNRDGYDNGTNGNFLTNG